MHGRPRPAEPLLPYLLIFPTLLIILSILIYPIIQGIATSVYRSEGLQPGTGRFVGLDNYLRLLTDKEFWNAVRVTVLYAFWCIVGTLAVGLGTALLLNLRFAGRGLARVIMTLPWAVPEVAASLIWIWMLNPDVGIVNVLATRLGLLTQNIRWLNQIEWALPTMLFVTIWKVFPFSSVVLLTALQAVPEELYEVAAIDGASPVQSFRHVTMPGIRPTLTLLTLLVTIWSLKRFTLIWVMTQGGPVGQTETLGLIVYRTAFKFFDMGYAAAIGVVGLAVSAIVTAVFLWVEQRRTEAA
jgi:multiple sugar transport system permease protein